MDDGRTRPRALFRRRHHHVAATAFLHEILLTADRLERRNGGA